MDNTAITSVSLSSPREEAECGGNAEEKTSNETADSYAGRCPRGHSASPFGRWWIGGRFALLNGAGSIDDETAGGRTAGT